MARFNAQEMEEQVSSQEVGEQVEEETPLKKLSRLIPQYKEAKSQADLYTKRAGEHNSEIKVIMVDNSLEEFEVDDIRVTCTTASKDIMLEEAMIERLRKLKQERKITSIQFNKIVKTREYIDNDALEAALYNNKIDGALLSGCFDTKETLTLRIGKVKKAPKEETNG